MRRLVTLVLLLAMGCFVRPPYDPAEICRDLVSEQAHLAQGSLKTRDLVELSLNTPAEKTARSAYAQKIAIPVLGGVGAAALAGGLVAGFATDQSQIAVRNAGYALVGGTIGLFAIALALNYTSRLTAEHARERLLIYSNQCQP